ncbi:MoaD family protein [Candidatus Methanoperedens nitroreducens]|uniref:MoaD family protein n=1 Tax=Candidatus Methanoperedens nitratireducens TaxID=1392998 RepID=A0A062V7T5_9EURY|nr:ubiquitin-like small modifier protein 1 [Candidatus Methanoperedens nitroreducens]KCZ73352.1 MoaD family protein [Candidatus Methanoperedens nitroreducens]MDJ1422699.1 MoaD family protein [Candidatus Methanoperedens sp.]
MVIVKFFSTLRNITEVREAIIEQEGSVYDILNALLSNYGDLKEAIFDEKGDIYINILLNGRNIEYLNGPATMVSQHDTLYLFPPIAGG